LMFREVSNFAWVLTGILVSAATFLRDTGFNVALYIGGDSPIGNERAILFPKVLVGIAKILRDFCWPFISFSQKHFSRISVVTLEKPTYQDLARLRLRRPFVWNNKCLPSWNAS
jgi:hypothetical protein